MPRPPGSPSRGRGFFSEDLSGDLVMVLASDKPVSVVAVVFIEATLPWPFVLYGFPEESVMEIPEISRTRVTTILSLLPGKV